MAVLENVCMLGTNSYQMRKGKTNDLKSIIRKNIIFSSVPGFFYHFPTPVTLSGGGLRGVAWPKFPQGGLAWPFSGPKGPKIGAEGAVLENFGKFSKKKVA